MGIIHNPPRDTGDNFQGDAHRERVRLVWWEGQCSRREKDHKVCPIHWDADEPKIYKMAFDCLGTYSYRKNFLQIDGIIPDGLMPAMNHYERQRLTEVLRSKLNSQTGYEVGKISTGIIDWEGVLTYK